MLVCLFFRYKIGRQRTEKVVRKWRPNSDQFGKRIERTVVRPMFNSYVGKSLLSFLQNNSSRKKILYWQILCRILTFGKYRIWELVERDGHINYGAEMSWRRIGAKMGLASSHDVPKMSPTYLDKWAINPRKTNHYYCITRNYWNIFELSVVVCLQFYCIVLMHCEIVLHADNC